MNVDGGASGHWPAIPDGHGPPQNWVSKLRVCELHAIMTHRHHIKPGLVQP
jgi:hypothetical protein